jgi:hypothetical protein
LRAAPGRGSSRSARTRLLAKRLLEIAFDETALGPRHRRGPHRHDAGNLVITAARIGRQQDLRPFEFAYGMLAAAQHRLQCAVLGLAQFDPVAYIHLDLLDGGRDASNGRAMSSAGIRFTDRQGQYLAFIDAYTRVHGRPPAEADMQCHFRVSPPSVHQMVLTLEREGLIRRQPGVPRSIEVLVAPECLPVLSPPQPVKTSVPRY